VEQIKKKLEEKGRRRTSGRRTMGERGKEIIAML